MIVECLKCHTRYRVNELLFRSSARQVRCSQCQHVFEVDKVRRIGCSICGIETSQPEDYAIRDYKGSPYAICPACADSFNGPLHERSIEQSEEGKNLEILDPQPGKPSLPEEEEIA